MKLIKTTAETSKPTLWKHAKIQNKIKLKLNSLVCWTQTYCRWWRWCPPAGGHKGSPNMPAVDGNWSMQLLCLLLLMRNLTSLLWETVTWTFTVVWCCSSFLCSCVVCFLRLCCVSLSGPLRHQMFMSDVVKDIQVVNTFVPLMV